MSSENNKISNPHRPLLNLSDKVDVRRSNKYFALSNFTIYYTWEIKKKTYKNNNKSKISGLTCNEKYDFPDGSYSVSDIEDYLEYIIKKLKYLLIILQ